MKHPWVAIDKNLVKTLKDINRPFSFIEATFSHSVNINCNRPFSVNGYAERWQWSRDKVRKFLSEIGTSEGYEAGKKGSGSGIAIHLVVVGHENKDNNTPRGVPDRKPTGSRQEADRLELTVVGLAGEYPTGSRQEADRKPDTIIKNKKKEKEYTSAFVNFYTLYPRKDKKFDAFKAWEEIPEIKHEEILSAISVQNKVKWEKTEAQFIPLPASWLRGRRWEDTTVDDTF